MAFDRHFRHRLGVLGDQMTRADVAVERHQFVEEAARPQHRIAAPALADRHRDQSAAVRRERLDQPVDQIAASISGMSPRQITAPSALSGTAAMPALTELASPPAKSGLRTNLTFKPASACSTSSA